MNYEKSCKKLQDGISVTKLNYSNNGSQEIELSLSNDRKRLICKDVNVQGKLRKIFKLGPKTETINLNDFVALVYGGTTSRFKELNLL